MQPIIPSRYDPGVLYIDYQDVLADPRRVKPIFTAEATKVLIIANAVPDNVIKVAASLTDDEIEEINRINSQSFRTNTHTNTQAVGLFTDKLSFLSNNSNRSVRTISGYLAGLTNIFGYVTGYPVESLSSRSLTTHAESRDTDELHVDFTLCTKVREEPAYGMLVTLHGPTARWVPNPQNLCLNPGSQAYDLAAIAYPLHNGVHHFPERSLVLKKIARSIQGEEGPIPMPLCSYRDPIFHQGTVPPVGETRVAFAFGGGMSY